MSILDCICNRGPTPQTSCVGLTQLLYRRESITGHTDTSSLYVYMMALLALSLCHRTHSAGFCTWVDLVVLQGQSPCHMTYSSVFFH